MKMKFVAFIACGGLFLGLAGCASAPINMTPHEMHSLKSIPKIVAIHHGPSAPAVTTGSGVLAADLTFGLSVREEGPKIVKKYGIKDPVVMVEKDFLQGVMKQEHFHNLYIQKKMVSYNKTSVADLQKRFKKGYYLQFIPGQWDVIYYMTNWSHYHMYFGVRARLVDLNDGKVLWNAGCSAPQDDGDNAPTIDQLWANDGALLKHWTYTSARECAAQLVKKFAS